GIEFGPANHVTAVNGCDEAIMGNNEISPVATTLGQPISPGVYATLPAPVKQVFVVHDNVDLNKIFIGRCFPVAFGAPFATVADPTDLNCLVCLPLDFARNKKPAPIFRSFPSITSANFTPEGNQPPLVPTLTRPAISLLPATRF